MSVNRAAAPKSSAVPMPDARRPLLPQRFLIVALVGLIGLAAYLWWLPFQRESQLRRASLPELQAAAKNQEDARAAYYLGLKLREQGDANGAYAALGRAATLKVADADIWSAFADSAKTAHGYQEAFNILGAFVKNNPQNAMGHLALSRLYMERNSYRRAREEARFATANNSKLAEAWRISGQSALAMELPADAEPDLRRALSVDPNDWQSQTALGDALATQNRFPDSVPVYTEAVRLAPREAVPALSLGRALMKSAPANATPEQLEPAREQLERSIALRGDIPISHLLLGQCLARQKRLPEARAALEQARDLAPANPDAYFELSRVAAQSGDRPAAAAFQRQHSEVLKRRNALGDRKRTLVAQIDNATAQNEQSKADSLRRSLGRVLAGAGEYSDALQQYGMLLLRYPNDTELQREANLVQQKMQETAFSQMPTPALLTEGDALFQQKQFVAAATAYKIALNREAKNSSAAEGLGLSLQALGRGEEATYYLLAATRLDAKRPRSEFALGLRYKEVGLLAEAQKRFQRVVDLEPKNAEAWRALGEVQRDRDGGEADAEISFQRAVDLEPKNLMNLLDLADSLDTNNKKASAETAFRQALALAPDSGEANSSLAAFLIDNPTGDARRDEAENLLKRALTLDSSDDFTRFYQGKLAMVKGNAPEAIRLLTGVLKNGQNAHSREIWYTLGRAYTKIGDRANAKKAMDVSHKLEADNVAFVQAREQVNLYPTDPERHLTLARAFATRTEYARAIREYERALRLDARRTDIAKELTALKSRLRAEGKMPSMPLYDALASSAHGVADSPAPSPAPPSR